MSKHKGVSDSTNFFYDVRENLIIRASNWKTLIPLNDDLSVDGLLTKTVRRDRYVRNKDLSQHGRNYIQEIK